EGRAGGLGGGREARPRAVRDGGRDRGHRPSGAAPRLRQDRAQDAVRAPGSVNMPQVKASQLREKTVEELQGQERTLREQIFKLRFQQATGQAESPHRIRAVRKQLARVLTVIHEKSAGATPAAGGEK